MTVDRPTTLPPQWAESLLEMMLPPRDRDSVCGDLLEEYRQSVVPALGAGANRWYLAASRLAPASRGPRSGAC